MAQKYSSRQMGFSSRTKTLDYDDDVFPSVDEIPRMVGYTGTSVRQKIAFFEKVKFQRHDQMMVDRATSQWEGQDRNLYDLTPVHHPAPTSPPPTFAIDPYEHEDIPLSPFPSKTTFYASPSNGSNRSSNSYSPTPYESGLVDEDDYIMDDSRAEEHQDEPLQGRCTFLVPNDIHPNMEHKEDDIQRLRLLAGKLSVEWGHADFMAPALARRLRDFQFAQEKRRKKYGDERPWGILGVYDHLASIRIDVEWAEDAARRRANGDSYQSWADYDEGKKGSNNRPYVTYILLFLCTTAMISSIAVNDWSIEPLDENPMVGPSAETLILMGAKESKLIVVQKEGWRLLTSAILHAGFVHFFVNMLALWFVGAAIETSHGWLAALIIFTLSAVGGSVLSAIFLPETISVGASGGIFGFIGACLADIMMNWRLLFSDIVSENGKTHRHAIVVIVLILDIFLNSIIGLTPFVDNYNHLGGMIYGFLCGLSTIQRLSADFFGMDEGWTAQAKQLVARFFGVLISLASITVTMIVLFNGDAAKTPCPGCTWLSCVPFPPWEDQDSKWWYCDSCGRVTADVVATPFFHLELDCPSGVTAFIELDAQTFDRSETSKRLPSYCRAYCPLFEAGLYNSSSLPN